MKKFIQVLTILIIVSNICAQQKTDPFYEFMKAIQKEDTVSAKELLDKGLDPNTKNSRNSSILMKAIDYERVDIIKYLIEKGAKINNQDKQGNTALHKAAMRGNKEIVNILVSNGANKNIKNNEGYKPVVYSATNQVADIIGKDEFTLTLDELLKKRIKISNKFDYSKLWPSDVNILFVGEYHRVPDIKQEAYELLTKFKEINNVNVLAMEFLTTKDQSVLDIYMKTPLPLEKFEDKFDLPWRFSDFKHFAKNNNLELIGLDVPREPNQSSESEEYRSSIKGMNERNSKWVEILKKLLIKNPNSKIFVYCGDAHSNYNSYAQPPVSSRLKNVMLNGKNIKIKVLSFVTDNMPDGPYYYAATRLKILGEHYVLFIPEDKAQLIGVDTLIGIPYQNWVIPEELKKNKVLPEVDL